MEFYLSIFKRDALFLEVEFSQDIGFKYCNFEAGADFNRAKFFGKTLFEFVEFGKQACFLGSQFKEAILFYACTFLGHTLFRGNFERQEKTDRSHQEDKDFCFLFCKFEKYVDFDQKLLQKLFQMTKEDEDKEKKKEESVSAASENKSGEERDNIEEKIRDYKKVGIYSEIFLDN